MFAYLLRSALSLILSALLSDPSEPVFSTLRCAQGCTSRPHDLPPPSHQPRYTSSACSRTRWKAGGMGFPRRRTMSSCSGVHVSSIRCQEGRICSFWGEPLARSRFTPPVGVQVGVKWGRVRRIGDSLPPPILPGQTTWPLGLLLVFLLFTQLQYASFPLPRPFPFPYSSSPRLSLFPRQPLRRLHFFNDGHRSIRLLPGSS